MGLVKAAPHEDVTYKIIGACIKVHNDIGPGHRESAYQKALVVGFQQAELTFEDELNIDSYYPIIRFPSGAKPPLGLTPVSVDAH
ncbi:MAG: GxxExxY protein [Anaerolineae bacterium]